MSCYYCCRSDSLRRHSDEEILYDSGGGLLQYSQDRLSNMFRRLILITFFTVVGKRLENNDVVSLAPIFLGFICHAIRDQ